MEHYQCNRLYKVFQTKDEITEPFYFAKELSNGEFIGKSYDEVDDAMTLEEIEAYIKENHVEPIIEDIF